jgi:pimeloyl-ACP methyl ester carboxylesterase
MGAGKTHFFGTSDGERLAFQTHGKPGNPTLLLIHGFTGSSDYFTRNYEALSIKWYVVAPDLRGHGNSQTRTLHGYHVPRLASDLKDLLEYIALTQAHQPLVGVGCSLGAAVLWSYSELFSSKAFSGMVFVDQAPLQDYIPGSWSIEQGNYGVHDPVSLAAAQATLEYAPDDFYRGLVQGCLGYRFRPNEVDKVNITKEIAKQDEDFFMDIARCGNSWW